MVEELVLETADIETATDAYAARFHGAAGEFFLETQTKILLSLFGTESSSTILDVGGGHGHIAIPLVRNGFNVTVTGSDNSCRGRLEANLSQGSYSYITTNSLLLPFYDQAFNYATAFRLLPHTIHYPALIKELCRVAEKGVIIDYPDRRSFNILYKYLFKKKQNFEGDTRPFTIFSRSEIAKLFNSNGFEVVSFVPEFFLPMVVYRQINNKQLSAFVENAFRTIGVTNAFGSPIIVKAVRKST